MAGSATIDIYVLRKWAAAPAIYFYQGDISRKKSPKNELQYKFKEWQRKTNKRMLGCDNELKERESNDEFKIATGSSYR